MKRLWREPLMHFLLLGAVLFAVSHSMPPAREAAPSSQAHLLNTGFGPFYDGLTHPFVTPEDLLPVVALTLLAGLRGAQCGRWVLLTLPRAWLAGMTVGLLLVPHGSAAWLTCKPGHDILSVSAEIPDCIPHQSCLATSA